MNQKVIPDSRGLTKRADWLVTFAGTPRLLELSGPGMLVRLVQSGKSTYDGLELQNSRRDGAFWFEWNLLARVHNAARLELAQQAAKLPFRRPISELAGNYMRHVFRDQLAVCKDWTNDFDGYLRIPLFPGDRLMAVVGAVRRQAAYSQNHSQHAAVITSNIWLEGMATQYVISFSIPGNKPFTRRIQGPFEF